MKTNNLWIVSLILSIILLTSGTVDIDWMVVAPRFNPWYFTVDYWEFAPYFRLCWHLAYLYTLLRIIIGSFVLGGTIIYLWLRLNK